MAKEYLEKLSTLVDDLKLVDLFDSTVETKHFFSGAALYVNEKICASWTPVGLAFKLPEAEVAELINSGKAIPLRYFPKGTIKKGYALFENPNLNDLGQWEIYFMKAAQQVK